MVSPFVPSAFCRPSRVEGKEESKPPSSLPQRPRLLLGKHHPDLSASLIFVPTFFSPLSDRAWASISSSASRSQPSQSYASSSARSSRSRSNSSYSTVGSPPQDRYRSSWSHLTQEPSSSHLSTPLVSTPTPSYGLNAYPTSEDNSFGLSFASQVDPFGLGGSGADWWEQDGAEGFPVEQIEMVDSGEEQRRDASLSSLGWAADLGWDELASSLSILSEPPSLHKYSYPSTSSDQQTPISPNPRFIQSSPHPTSVPSFHPPPPPPSLPLHQSSHHHHHLSHTSYHKQVASIHTRSARPTFIALPAGSNRPSTASSSSSHPEESLRSNEDFATALGRIREEKGKFKLVLPVGRKSPGVIPLV